MGSGIVTIVLYRVRVCRRIGLFWWYTRTVAIGRERFVARWLRSELHQDQDVGDLGAFEESRQEMTDKDQEADTEDGDFHSGKTTAGGETWEVLV
jgi:hypothetical protein